MAPFKTLSNDSTLGKITGYQVSTPAALRVSFCRALWRADLGDRSGDRIWRLGDRSGSQLDPAWASISSVIQQLYKMTGIWGQSLSLWQQNAGNSQNAHPWQLGAVSAQWRPVQLQREEGPSVVTVKFRPCHVQGAAQHIMIAEYTAMSCILPSSR